MQPRAKVNLSDFLTTATNGHVPRGPFEYSVMRIGKKRDGSKVGVFLYCQQHAREWATPLTCLETAEQLLRNYAIDKADAQARRQPRHLHPAVVEPRRRALLDPQLQPAAAQPDQPLRRGREGDRRPERGELLDAADQPRAPAAPYVNTDPGSRNAWGVDLNRNNTFGTIFDGYIGASYSCTSDVFAGPAEASEPEIKNELWIADTFTNIKFSNNIHSFGGYFMWAPGTYLPDRGEGDAVHANIGVEKYFFAAGDRILNRIKEVRNTVILPERTGPIADVLYSAAGNSADEHWYNRGVIAYSFETGADRFGPTALTQPAAAGATGDPGRRTAPGGSRATRSSSTTGTPNAETRTVADGRQPEPAEPGAEHHARRSRWRRRTRPARRCWGDDRQVGVGFQPPYATEGKFEALEFAAGNYGLLESAFAYARDDTPPQVRMTGADRVARRRSRRRSSSSTSRR